MRVQTKYEEDIGKFAVKVAAESTDRNGWLFFMDKRQLQIIISLSYFFHNKKKKLRVVERS